MLSIGALAAQSGHRASALRYYEEVGLLNPVARVGGRRRYEPEAVHQLGLIALLQDVGFTLDEIPHAAIANPADDPLRHLQHREAKGLRPGGFGVLLAQRLVDELVYSEQGNEVVLIKYLDLEPRGDRGVGCG